MAARLEKALPLQSASHRDAAKIARHFSAGSQTIRMKLVPLGTIESFGNRNLSRPLWDLLLWCIRNPGTEVPGYYQRVPTERSLDINLPPFWGLPDTTALWVECSFFQFRQKNIGIYTLSRRSRSHAALTAGCSI
jgi:hypothetical protein